MALIGVGGVLLIGITVGVTLWATGALSKTQGGTKADNSTGTATSAEPNKAVSAKIAEVQLVPISGELFVTTKGGDVKKAAGQGIHLTPITPDLQKSVITFLANANECQARWNRVFEEGYGKYKRGVQFNTPAYKSGEEAFDREFRPNVEKAQGELKAALDSALSVLLSGARSAVADSDGKFKLEIPAGRYVLWTDARTMAQQSFSWCKIVEAREAPVNLILSEGSVFLYSDSPDAKEREPTHRLLREIAFELARGNNMAKTTTFCACPFHRWEPTS
jgi:hypothetical protein